MKKTKYDKIKKQVEERGVLVRLSLRELDTLGLALTRGTRPILDTITGDENQKEWDLRLRAAAAAVDDARHLISLRLQARLMEENLEAAGEIQARAAKTAARKPQ